MKKSDVTKTTIIVIVPALAIITYFIMYRMIFHSKFVPFGSIDKFLLSTVGTLVIAVVYAMIINGTLCRIEGKGKM